MFWGCSPSGSEEAWSTQPKTANLKTVAGSELLARPLVIKTPLAKHRLALGKPNQADPVCAPYHSPCTFHKSAQARGAKQSSGCLTTQNSQRKDPKKERTRKNCPTRPYPLRVPQRTRQHELMKKLWRPRKEVAGRMSDSKARNRGKNSPFS